MDAIAAELGAFATDFAIRDFRAPVVRQPAEPIATCHDVTLQRFIEGLNQARIAAGGIGIAAPQVGIARRVVIIEIPEAERAGYGHVPPTPLLVLINPLILYRSAETLRAAEACLSIKGYEGVFERPRRVIVEALTRDGTRLLLHADGLLARALQHEVDHLEGILYPDRLTRLADLRRVEPVASQDPVLSHNPLLRAALSAQTAESP